MFDAQMLAGSKTSRAGDIALGGAVWGAVLLIVAVFLWMLGDLVLQGTGRLSFSFLLDTPRDAGRSGGIWPILLSTLLILGVTMAVAMPLGLATAVFLSEFTRSGGRSGQIIGLSLDVLAGVPSIVFGLFGYAFFCIWLGLGFSILFGGLTLACMVLPILIRTTESGLRMVPNDWRHGAAALGLSRSAALQHILLPAALPAIMAGLMLGIGRAAAETAALIFTSGYVDRVPSSLFDSGRALSVHIYDMAMNVAGGDGTAYASAIVLIALLVLVNGTAITIGDRLLARRFVSA
jgi:phosphate transport system permease protein